MLRAVARGDVTPAAPPPARRGVHPAACRPALATRNEQLVSLARDPGASHGCCARDPERHQCTQASDLMQRTFPTRPGRCRRPTAGQWGTRLTESTKRSMAARSLGSVVGALGAGQQVGEVGRQRGADAGGPLDGVGELRRVGGRQRDDRHARGAPSRRRRRCRPPCAGRPASRSSRSVADDRPASRRRRARRPGRRRRSTRGTWSASTSSRPLARNRCSCSAVQAAVAPVHLEQQALEVRRHLDVHARAERRHDLRRRHVAVVDEPGEDVVACSTRSPASRSARPSAGRSTRRARCRSCRSAR